MKRLFIVLLSLFLAVSAIAQAPAHYYDSAEGLRGNALKEALHNIIKGHTSISYAQIWNAFWSTDNKGNGVVWDMYSDVPGGTPPYTYQLGMDQCGNYSGEGDCYNREHSWPQSWFNDQTTPRTDMHHIFATDGYVNGRRNNYAYGEVSGAKWTSRNGSKLGSCKTPGFSGTVFEPIDEYKGDLARALMYMSVRYYGEDSNWKSSDMTDKSEIKPWAMAMLLRWNKQDPVSQKEIDRNNAIYKDYQHNRNPFVDYPEYADMIWDPNWVIAEDESESAVSIYPSPVQRGGTIYLFLRHQEVDQVTIYDLSGRVLWQTKVASEEMPSLTLPNDLQSGFYLLHLSNGNQVVMNRKLLII
ncbi:MAG: endonuclease [Bacteroidales bacterium]|nr:endonuclease [Bacteroidales bacterium]